MLTTYSSGPQSSCFAALSLLTRRTHGPHRSVETSETHGSGSSSHRHHMLTQHLSECFCVVWTLSVSCCLVRDHEDVSWSSGLSRRPSQSIPARVPLLALGSRRSGRSSEPLRSRRPLSGVIVVVCVTRVTRVARVTSRLFPIRRSRYFLKKKIF